MCRSPSKVKSGRSDAIPARSRKGSCVAYPRARALRSGCTSVQKCCELLIGLTLLQPHAMGFVEWAAPQTAFVRNTPPGMPPIPDNASARQAAKTQKFPIALSAMRA